MSQEDKFSIENIETKTMSILYSNIDKCFSQYALFDKLIKDKFPENYNTSINPTIKAKFLLVLRNLASRFDDIEVTKKLNVFYVTCLSDSNDKSKVTNYVPTVQETLTNQSINQSGIYNNTINQQDNISTPYFSLDYCDLINYILENNLSENINYVDPFDGNTIYHDLVATGNFDKIKALVEVDKFDFTVKNKHDVMPIELSKNMEIIMYLNKSLSDKYIREIKKINEEIELIKTKNTLLNLQVVHYTSDKFKENILIKTSIIEIVKLKIFTQYQQNKLLIFSLAILYIAWVFIF